MADCREPSVIMARIKALAAAAEINASNHGGDRATAAADLMCAFVLISMRAEADPKKAADVMLPNAIGACHDFFADKGILQ